jgi:hypothetical protein
MMIQGSIVIKTTEVHHACISTLELTTAYENGHVQKGSVNNSVHFISYSFEKLGPLWTSH